MKRSFKIVAILLLLSLIFGCSSTDSKKKVTKQKISEYESGNRWRKWRRRTGVPQNFE